MITNYERILDVILDDLIPLTKISINEGNKIFGGFIVKKSDLSLVCLGTNQEIKNPLFHGEISTLDRKSTRLNSSHSQQSRMPSSA